MSDATPFGFGKFVPGFEFLQNLGKGASGGIPHMPQLANWVAPTISVEELEKRIEELKAVQFWLDQNSRALTATVQALEVQKMTLATLKGMNVHMADVANAFKTSSASGVMGSAAKASASAARAASAATGSISSRAADWASPAAPPAPARDAPAATPAAAMPEPAADSGPAALDSSATQSKAPAGDDAGGASPGIVDPLQWWSALTQQFQQIASSALKDAAQHAARDSIGKKPAADSPAPRKAAVKKTSSRSQAASKSRSGAARKTPTTKKTKPQS